MTTGTPSPNPATPPVWFNAWLNGTFETQAKALNDQRARLDAFDAWRDERDAEMETLKSQMNARLTRQNLAATTPAHATPEPEAAPPLIAGVDQVAIPPQLLNERRKLSFKWIGLLIGAATGILIDILIGVLVPYEFLERIPGALTTILYILIFGICTIIGYMVGESKDTRTT